jgi:hypothetical protein
VTQREKRDQAQPGVERREAARRVIPRLGGRRADDPPAEWVTVTAFALRYGVDRSTVYKWLDSELLLTYRVGKLLRIRNLPPDAHEPLKSVDAR